MSITTEELEKAVQKLEDALMQEKNEYLRDSVIQRFEFCIELSWKTAKKIMGSSSSAPKIIVREMAQNGFIRDAELWLKSIDMKNLSSHTYKEDLAETVYEFAKNFLTELKQLSGNLKSK